MPGLRGILASITASAVSPATAARAAVCAIRSSERQAWLAIEASIGGSPSGQDPAVAGDQLLLPCLEQKRGAQGLPFPSTLRLLGLAAEQFHDRRRSLVGNRQRLRTKLLLDLQ